MNKALILMREAERDLGTGNYNKAVSASYFAVRMVAELLLRDLRTRKDDKIANALGRVMGEDSRRELMYLFERRKEADHRDRVFTREEAEDVVSRARSLLERILERIERDGSGSQGYGGGARKSREGEGVRF
ncbi:MAG: HEPN domain-containing protein [Candidatus Korarchaeota archaeon NZ13-K]|nr:MAG: HEPN domain-containing protein [Candidatus Korarchaeota archaeon NZ13-K]